MSDFVEKTLGSMPSLITGGLVSDRESPTARTRTFRNFVQSIANINSKHEEEDLVTRELSQQKLRLSKTNLTAAQKRESLTRIVYCSLLGYDVSFACIHAVKLAQQGALQEKKVGYLVCALLLHENHDFVVLLVNTIQKDLRSTDVLEVCTALTAITQLMSPEMIPPLLPLVQEKLTHPKEMVRRKAVLCLQYMLRKAPEMRECVEPGFRRALEDSDPGVVWASLHGFYQLILTDPSRYKDIVPGLCDILSQIISHRLTVDYEYHSVPAPWTVVLLLKLLARLGAGDLNTSQKIYPILKDVLKLTEPSHKMGLAVIYECMQTITSIYPHPALVDLAARCVGRFLSSHNINLRYIGLKALTSLVQVNPLYATDHQQTVLDCLSHSHQTIRVKTLSLLYRMANQTNVHVISDRLLEQLPTTTDQHQRLDIVLKVVDITCRLQQNVSECVVTMNKILMMADESLIPDDACERVISILQGEQADSDTRSEAVMTYWDLLRSSNLTCAMLQTAAWVLGEYSHLVTSPDTNQIATILIDWFARSSRDVARLWILSALTKLNHQVAAPEEAMLRLQGAVAGTMNAQVRQAVRELGRLSEASQTLRGAFKPRGDVNSTHLDFSLSFLDGYVIKSLESGAQPYLPRGLRHASTQPRRDSCAGLGYAAYQDASSVTGSGRETLPGSLPSDAAPHWSSSVSVSSEDSRWTVNEESGLRTTHVKKVWSREGLLKPDKSQVTNSTLHVTQDEDEEVTQNADRRRLAAALFGSLTDTFAPQGHIAPTEHSMLRSREGISNGGQDVTSAATPRHDTSRQMTSYDASAPSRGPVVDDVHSTKDAHAAIETDDNETNTTAEDFSHLSVSCKPCDSDEGLLSKDVT